MTGKTSACWRISCLITILSLFSLRPVFSQHPVNNEFSKNTFYLELASKGSIYSVNFDHIFRRGDKLSYSYRIGFSIEKNGISFPVGINMITGKKSHHAEFGLTLIPYIEQYKTFLSGNNVSDKYLYIIPSVGYRFQPHNGGFFLKAGVSPLIFLDPPSDNFWKMDPRLFFYGNAGVGFSF
jgi:hypothetical protein